MTRLEAWYPERAREMRDVYRRVGTKKGAAAELGVTPSMLMRWIWQLERYEQYRASGARVPSHLTVSSWVADLESARERKNWDRVDWVVSRMREVVTAREEPE
jgi:uncharacterized protein (DUF2336 family)